MSAYEDEYDDRPVHGWWSTLVVLTSWSVSAAVVFLVLALGFVVEMHRAGPPSAGGGDTIVVIPRGQGVTGIAQQLDAAHLLRNPFTFRIAAEIYGRRRPLMAGEYAIPSGASPRAILDKLLAGKVLLHPVTVPEGWTSAMVAERLAGADFLAGPPAPPPPEGVLLPETYRVPRGETRAAVLAEMKAAHDRTLADLWAHRAPGLPLKTPEEAVVLASIVEKETAVPAERPLVAAVFVNRLRKGMRLETDPTVIYGVCKIEPKLCADGRLIDEKTGQQRGIRQSELALQTGYNTYRIYGLPPTPIANPGRASIEAALNPAKTGDLYFVANGAGGHVFAASLVDHKKNVAKWRQIEKARAD